MNIEVILISGKSGSGKDYYARKISLKLDRYGYKTKIVHFADYLKYILKEYKDWNGFKDNYGRDLLIKVGNGKRDEDDRFWARHLANEIDMVKKEYDVFIVADLRYKSEKQEMIDRFTCRTIRIIGEHEDTLTDGQKSNISECELDDCGKDFFDFFIDSEYDIDNFLEVYYGIH